MTWLPESPRYVLLADMACDLLEPDNLIAFDSWLLLRGREQEAKKVLEWLHTSREDFDLEKEFEIMRDAVASEPESGACKYFLLMLFLVYD